MLLAVLVGINPLEASATSTSMVVLKRDEGESASFFDGLGRLRFFRLRSVGEAFS